MKSVAILATFAGVAVAQLSSCAQTCVDNMNSIAQSQFGCSAGDLTCQCGTANWAYGVRDCSAEACGASDAAQAVSYAAAMCQNVAQSISATPTGLVILSSALASATGGRASSIASSVNSEASSIASSVNGEASSIAASVSSQLASLSSVLASATESASSVVASVTSSVASEVSSAAAAASSGASSAAAAASSVNSRISSAAASAASSAASAASSAAASATSKAAAPKMTGLPVMAGAGFAAWLLL